jgi:hypothetical protein
MSRLRYVAFSALAWCLGLAGPLMLIIWLGALSSNSIGQESLRLAQRADEKVVAEVRKNKERAKFAAEANYAFERSFYLRGYVDCMQGRAP